MVGTISLCGMVVEGDKPIWHGGWDDKSMWYGGWGDKSMWYGGWGG